MLQNDSSNILLSSYVGLLGQLFSRCASTVDGATQTAFAEFITQLFQSDKEDDSIYLLTLLVNSYGGQSDEVLQMAKDLLSNRLTDANNEDDLCALVDLCCSTISVQTEHDFDFERFSVDGTMPYVQRPEITYKAKSKIMSMYQIVNNTFPEIIGEKAAILFEFLTSEDSAYRFGIRGNSDIALTVLRNLPHDEMGTPKQLKQLIRETINAYSCDICYGCFSYAKNSEESQNKKVRCAMNIYELLCISESFGLGGQIKIWDNQYDSVRRLIPEENLEHFLQLQPPPHVEENEETE